MDATNAKIASKPDDHSNRKICIFNDKRKCCNDPQSMQIYPRHCYSLFNFTFIYIVANTHPISKMIDFFRDDLLSINDANN